MGGNVAGGIPGYAAVSKFGGAQAPAIANTMNDLNAAGITARTPQMYGKEGGLFKVAPLTRNAVGDQAQDAMSQYGTYMEGIAPAADVNAAPNVVGSRVQAAGQTYLKNMNTETSANKVNLRNFVPGDTPVDADNLYNHLGLTRNADGNLAIAPGNPYEDANVPAYIQGMRDRILKNNPAGDLTWRDVDAMRKGVGQQSLTTQMQGDASSAQFDQAYSVLSQDMKAAAAAKGPEAEAALAQYNAEYTAKKAFVNDQLQKLAALKQNGQPVDPQEVYKRLMAQPGKNNDLQRLVDNGVLSQADIDLMAKQQIRDMGLKPTPNGLVWSPSQFATKYAALQKTNPEGAKFLFGGNAEQYDQVARISQNLASTEKMAAANANKSGIRFFTGPLAEAGAYMGAAHLAGLGGPATLAAVPVGLGIDKALSRLYTSPAFLNYVTKPVLSPQKFVTGLNSLSRMNPELAPDLKTLSSSIRE
jgi:hypothetical protein